MALKPSLTVRMGQQLRMTPQLQQAIRLLQLSTLELEVEIQEALDSNFMLEEVDQEPADSEGQDSAALAECSGGLRKPRPNARCAARGVAHGLRNANTQSVNSLLPATRTGGGCSPLKSHARNSLAPARSTSSQAACGRAGPRNQTGQRTALRTCAAASSARRGGGKQ